jgi:enterochelin esterase family protein
MIQSKGNIKIIEHESNILRNNPLADSCVRDLCVYLPPDYDSSGADYPVTYCLAGFTGSGRMMINKTAFNPNMPERLDRLIAENVIEPMIVVMPDMFTRYGGSQFLNSSATGQYEDYLTDELVPFVDREFRTKRDRVQRAVTGISSGGYGSMIMAIRHSNLFGIAASISGDCFFEMCYKPDFGRAFRGISGNPLRLVENFYDETLRSGKYDFDGLNAIGMASCYSPNSESEWGFDLPFDLESGLPREDVWKRWLKHDPFYLVETAVEELRTMKLLYIEAGTSDEVNLDIGARAVVGKLRKYDVPVVHVEFEGGHFGIKHRYDHVLKVISEAFCAGR